MTHFAVQESIIKTVEAVVEAYGLKSLPGSEGEVTVHEEVELIAKTYKSGDSVPFTATLKAGLNPDKPLIKAVSATAPLTSSESNAPLSTVEALPAVATSENADIV